MEVTRAPPETTRWSSPARSPAPARWRWATVRDSFTIQDGANLAGLATPVDGGAGIDAFIADIAGSATLGGAVNFETLSKTNTGTLHVDGPALSAFSTVNVNGGTLDIGAGGRIAGAATTSVNSGATLQVDGSYAGSAGGDSVTLSGTLAGTGTIELLDGDDVFTLNTGATVAFTGVVDAAGADADRFVLSGSGTGTFDMGLVGTVFQNFEDFSKEGSGTWRLAGAGDRDWTVSARHAHRRQRELRRRHRQLRHGHFRSVGRWNIRRRAVRQRHADQAERGHAGS